MKMGLQSWVLPAGSGGESISCPFRLWKTPVSLSLWFFPHITLTSVSVLTSPLTLTLLLLSHTGPCDFIGRSQTIQDHLSIARSLT